MALFLAHTAILFWASLAAARPVVRSTLERLLAAVLFAWGNIVVTSLLLSCLHELGKPAWFFRTSLLLAFATWLGLRRVTPVPVIPVTTVDAKPSPLLVGAFILTLAPIVYASIRIAGTYVPNNYDSLVYHLPRAMFYLGQNTLAHFDTGNPRQVYFPFNYNLLQLFGLIYSPPTQCVNFINLAAWGVAGLAIYRLARLCALSANSALVAAWLALTSTQILAQATATTNDLPTGTGLLCTLVFILQWRLTRRTRDALLAGLGAGLTIGAKLTVIFFAPAAGLLLLILAWQHWRRGEVRAFFTGVRAWVVPGLVALILASPFALINLAEKGEWINKTYDFTLNRPFKVASAVQTAEAYLVQLFIEPLHRFTYDLQFTAQLNAWGQRALFPHWNAAYAFSPLYLFPPDLNEDHVWFGFAGPFILLCALLCVVRHRRFAPPAAWLGALGIGWLATYFLLNKWSLYNQRYFVPAILVMSPCVAAVVEAQWRNPRFRRSSHTVLIALAASAVWLAGIYLFKNTSRPYAPLWAGTTVPAALPVLPPLMVERLSNQPRVNIDSTDGNERIFLLMTLGENQRFTSFAKTNPAVYNVFSEWGFPRKVAYSNIEQLSSYTIVAIPTKATAGVEFLGTLGSGQPALDYYGLVPHPEQAPATDGNHNVLVFLSYGPRDPGRYAHLHIKVAGLNAPDHARLTVGVEYDDGTLAPLATFTTTGEAPASVTRPIRRFTVRVADQTSGQEIGSIDIPYLFRDQPPEVEAPDNPLSLFSNELVAVEPPAALATTGLATPEGPYPQWGLPLIRWAKAPVVRVEIPANAQLGRLELAFSLRLHARDSATVDVVLNGELVKSYQVDSPAEWIGDDLMLTPKAGANILEFRNVTVGTEPDWLDYLERYPDVKAYVQSLHLPPAEGARQHYETFGKHETRTLNLRRRTETIAMPQQLYYVFRNLRLDGIPEAMSAAATPSSGRERNAYIDTLRGWSIFGVVCVHFAGSFVTTDAFAWSPSFYLGLTLNQVFSFAVPMFVFLSGLLAGSSRTPVTLGEYYRGRFWRIAFPYLIVSFLSFFLLNHHAEWQALPGYHARFVWLFQRLCFYGVEPTLYFIPLILQLYVLQPALKALPGWLNRAAPGFSPGRWAVLLTGLLLAVHLVIGLKCNRGTLDYYTWARPNPIFWMFYFFAGLHFRSLTGFLTARGLKLIGGIALLAAAGAMTWNFLHLLDRSVVGAHFEFNRLDFAYVRPEMLVYDLGIVIGLAMGVAFGWSPRVSVVSYLGRYTLEIYLWHILVLYFGAWRYAGALAACRQMPELIVMLCAVTCLVIAGAYDGWSRLLAFVRHHRLVLVQTP